MDNIGVVQVVEGLADLINDILLVFLFQDGGLPNQCVEVHVHVLEDQIDVDVVIGLHDSLQFDYVRVT